MNDSAFIAGWATLTGALMALSFGLGRWERRTIYKPGPPAEESKSSAAFMYELGYDVASRLAADESVRLVPRYPSEAQQAEMDAYREATKNLHWSQKIERFDVGVAQDPTIYFNIKLPEGADTPAYYRALAWDVARRTGVKGSHEWPPPGIDSASQVYEIWREEQDHWFDLYGDPTKKAGE